LYAEHTREIALDVHVDCETYDLPPAQEEQGVGRRFHITDLGPFKLLDAVATCDPAGRQVTLAVVNRDRDREHRVTIQFVGGSAHSGVHVAEVNGAGPDAINSFDHPDAVGVREHRMNVGGSGFEYVFSAHSVTVLRFELA
jgi:alpha-N-arabinofuranosidase